ncbi:MAG: N-acetyltransferase [Chloroflexi bacterium]|nr:N-acetyltransferase [Chloroflexota bacterium]
MAVDVSPVAGQRDHDAFLRLPWQIYRGHAHWVPPILDHQRALLDRTRHPFHQHAEVEYVLARRRGAVVGRIAAIVNGQHVRYHGEPAGFFGFFECVDDAEVAAALLDAAGRWVADRGMELLRGPMSFSTNEECGMLVEGFTSPPIFMAPYNPPSYPSLMDRCGMEKAKDLYAYSFSRQALDPARYQQAKRLVAQIIERHGITVRPPDMQRFHDELALIREVYQRAWGKNWGFVPMTAAEFDHQAAQLKSLIVPELVRVATVAGDPAAFTLLVPNYNEAIKHINGRLWPFGIPFMLACHYLRRIRGLRVLALGVVPEHQRRGIDTVMIFDLYSRLVHSHYQWCEIGWVLEDNARMNNTIRAWGGTLSKRYRIYQRML